MCWPARILWLENSRSTTNMGLFPFAAVGGRRGAPLARVQPAAHLRDLVPDELVVVKRICKRRDALASSEQVHCQRLGIRLVAEQRKLARQPGAKQREQHVRAGL